MPCKQQVPHFHLCYNVEYASMINCSIYISWKTKFGILTILNGKTSKIFSVLIDKELFPFFFFHILMKGYIWHTFLTQWVQSEIHGTTSRAPFYWIYFWNFLLKLLLRRTLSMFVTDKLTTDCAKKCTNKPLRVWLFSSNSMRVNKSPRKCQQS